MAKQIQKILTGLLLVVIATLTASAAVTAAAASKIKEYYDGYKNKTRVKGCRFHSFLLLILSFILQDIEYLSDRLQDSYGLLRFRLEIMFTSTSLLPDTCLVIL